MIDALYSIAPLQRDVLGSSKLIVVVWPPRNEFRGGQTTKQNAFKDKEALRLPIRQQHLGDRGAVQPDGINQIGLLHHKFVAKTGFTDILKWRF